MPDELTAKMIDASVEKNAVQFKELMDASMNERIASQLRDTKMEISNKIFENSKEFQMKLNSKKKKEAAMDKNDLAMKGSSINKVQ